MANTKGKPAKGSEPVVDRRVTQTPVGLKPDETPAIGPDTPVHPTSNPMDLVVGEDTPVGAPADPAQPAIDQPPAEPGTKPINWEERHGNLERRFGEQGEEVGLMRKELADYKATMERMVTSTMYNAPPATPQTPAAPTLQPGGMTKLEIEEGIVADPSKVVHNIEDNVFSRTMGAIEQQNALARLKTTHPDHLEVGVSPAFNNWVRDQIDTGKFTTAMYNTAANDLDSIAILISRFKDSQPDATPPVIGGPTPVTDPSLSREAIAVELATKRTQANLTTGIESRVETDPLPEYSWLELSKMQLDDPARYERENDQITAAIAEGRVK